MKEREKTQVFPWERTKYEKTEAMKALEAQIAQDPKNDQLWFELSQKYDEAQLCREQVEALSHAIAINPFCGIYYRWRGHRHLSCWQFAEANSDLEMAARLIPENWDVWYHLSLSYFLLRDYKSALRAYEVCYRLTKTTEDLIPISDWYWTTLIRLGEKDKAQEVLNRIAPDIDYGINTCYYRRLMAYKGVIDPDRLQDETDEDRLNVVTQKYGLANLCLANGDEEKRRAILNRIFEMADNENWTSMFAYLAARVDMDMIHEQAVATTQA